jgi:hypothetical protein
MTRDLLLRAIFRAALLAPVGLGAPWALAQSFCSSDGQSAPGVLLERFISADCEACWADGSAPAAAGDLALDWIVPSSRGEDAPLSAAASRDALARLESLRRPAPKTAQAVRRRAESPLAMLRVSHGLPLNDYLGTSIELKSPPPGRWKGWLLLVETIPAGAEGSPIERNLVRNALVVTWGAERPLSKEERSRLFESRPMSIPPGARPERLRVVGWFEDGPGRIRAIAQSRCPPAAPAR